MMCVRSSCFTAVGLGPPKGVSIDRLSGVGASAGFVFCPEGSAVWPQCWLCAVYAVGHVGCWGGGGTLWG